MTAALRDCPTGTESVAREWVALGDAASTLSPPPLPPTQITPISGYYTPGISGSPASVYFSFLPAKNIHLLFNLKPHLLRKLSRVP